MELQWPLIIFTTLVAWSAGLFGAQAVMALRGAGKKAQLPALICSVALLAVGGIAVFFHLEHWERIFNGFGHITSGITQELIAIVVVVIVMVAYFVLLRKSDDGGTVPKWLAMVAIAMSVVLVAVMAHSYTMAARPAWDSLLWLAYVVGNACVLGPATMSIIMVARGDDLAPVELPALAGAAANAVAAVAFAVFLQMSGSAFAQVGNYFDPTQPTKAMADAAGVIAGQAPLLWMGAVVVGALVPLVAVFMAKRKGDASGWKLWGVAAIAAALAGAVCLRVVFYERGMCVFIFS
ncbi:MAG: DmsC/YnfH family molybdoenzyme membrane anchor subunit [Gordonibacter sp.]|uniref:dimethyl sulfoxide reductase anchor subunit family protein n=1 Tax=Gordonibacter sp. TaxID=1968902 RepID=UPI002FCC8522